MSVRSGQTVTVEFITSSFSTGAATSADSLPAGTLAVNGVDNAAAVTVTNVDAGRYRAAVTLPTLAVGDVAELVVAATVGGVAGKGVVWRDTKDVLLDGSGGVTAGAVSDKTGYSLTQAFPANFAALGISAGGHVGSVDTLTTYTGNTPQTGDSYARLGLPAGASVSADVAAVKASVGSPQQAGSAVTLPAIPANWVTAAGVAAAALSGKGDWLTAAGYTAPPAAAANAAAVWQDAAAGDFAAAGSVGKSLAGAFASPGSSVFTAAALANAPGGAGSDPLASQVPGSYAGGTAGNVLGNVLAKLSGVSVTTVSPLAAGGTLPLVAGDSYYDADGRAAQWTNASGSWPNLTGASLTLALGGQSAPAACRNPGQAAQAVYAELAAGLTAALPVGGTYRLLATLATGHTLTLAEGAFAASR